MIKERGGAPHARRGSIDRTLDLADGDNSAGFFGCGSGLHSQRRIVQAVLIGDGDGDGVGSAWARLLTDKGGVAPETASSAWIGKMAMGLI